MTRRVIRFTVSVIVDDHGEFDERYVANAIYEGIRLANDDGYLTSYNDATSVVMGWDVANDEDRLAPHNDETTEVVGLGCLLRERSRVNLTWLRRAPDLQVIKKLKKDLENE